MNKNRRVLVIDDNRFIHDDFRKILSPPVSGTAALDATESALFGETADVIRHTQFEIDSAYQGEEGMLLAKEAFEAGLPYAMAFVDVRMPPGWDGVETTERIWAIDPDIQIVLCTAFSDYSWEEMFKKLGHRDGLVILKKPFDTIEVLQLAHAFTEKWWLRRQSLRKMEELESQVAERTKELSRANRALISDLTERTRAADELRESERRFSDMLRNLDLVSMMLDREARITYCNNHLLRMTGWGPEEVIGRNWFELFLPPEFIDVSKSAYSALIEDQPAAWHNENEILTRSGARRRIRWNNSVLRSAVGSVIGTASIGEDITERNRLEAQLFQSQKLETVGKLAGGVAHGFNSILTVILGQSELILSGLPPGDALSKNVAEIHKAAERAAILTRQLLAYGRKQLLQPRILDLNAVISRMENIFPHVVGSEIGVRLIPSPGLGAVKADLGQIEQVIMNIVMNAGDAMPHGGKLTLETATVTLGEGSVERPPELKPGDYVLLAITDTGKGMSAEVRARVFEPFFTTKDVGQGTGLGLSTCYGIIKQSGGDISVWSEPGAGAIFKIYLPRVEPEAKVTTKGIDLPDLPRGTETILLVDGDSTLCEISAALLRRLGYTVLRAANGLDALVLKEKRGTGHIDLLFTDVALSDMSGKELAYRVRALCPKTRIIFSTDHPENPLVHQAAPAKGVAVLKKPFSPSALARKLRETLDE